MLFQGCAAVCLLQHARSCLAALQVHAFLCYCVLACVLTRSWSPFCFVLFYLAVRANGQYEKALPGRGPVPPFSLRVACLSRTFECMASCGSRGRLSPLEKACFCLVLTHVCAHLGTAALFLQATQEILAQFPLAADARKVAYAKLETDSVDPFPKGGSLLSPEVAAAGCMCMPRHHLCWRAELSGD